MPVALTIAGFDPSGGAGVIADVKTFTAFGCFATAAVTSLTFQNTTGVFGAAHQTAADVRAQVLPVVEPGGIQRAAHVLRDVFLHPRKVHHAFAQYRGLHLREVDGRDGPDPVRYGDWEVKGLAADF